VEAEHAEADMILQHRHWYTSLRYVSTHQDIWDPHLHHTIPFRSFKKWTPTSGSLAEQEWEKPLIRNTAVSQRCATVCRGKNVRLGIEEPFVCSNYRSNTYIHHRCYKCTIFVRTRKRIRITK
jgi:hypothetical protein